MRRLYEEPTASLRGAGPAVETDGRNPGAVAAEIMRLLQESQEESASWGKRLTSLPRSTRPSYSAFPRMTPATSGSSRSATCSTSRSDADAAGEDGGKPGRAGRRVGARDVGTGKGAVPADVRVDEPPHAERGKACRDLGVRPPGVLRPPRHPHPPVGRVDPRRKPVARSAVTQPSTSSGDFTSTVPRTSRSTPSASSRAAWSARPHAAAHLQAAGDGRRGSARSRRGCPCPSLPPRPGPRCGSSARPRSAKPRAVATGSCGVAGGVGEAAPQQPHAAPVREGRWRGGGAAGSAGRPAGLAARDRVVAARERRS